MHDIRAIRDNPAAFDAAMARRGVTSASSDILGIDEARRAHIHAAETAQADQNKASKEVGAAKAKGDDAEFERLRALVAEKKAEVAAMQAEAKKFDEQLTELLMGLPNLPYDDTPDGADEDDNVEIHRWGEPQKFDFTPKEHFDLDGVKPGMDFETAAQVEWCAIRCPVGRRGADTPGAGAVHAGHAYRGKRADRDLDAGAGAARDDVRHRAVAEIRRRQL